MLAPLGVVRSLFEPEDCLHGRAIQGRTTSDWIDTAVAQVGMWSGEFTITNGVDTLAMTDDQVNKAADTLIDALKTVSQ
ncbi:hypothetical protein [Nocardia sp. NPDC005825]|uniref:hypothetical protein n=1 Tax=unclassified Nocardia TaxID=2637762 RepID=UPI0033D14986